MLNIFMNSQREFLNLFFYMVCNHAFFSLFTINMFEKFSSPGILIITHENDKNLISLVITTINDRI